MTLKTKVSNSQNKNGLGILFGENTSYSKLSEVKLITIGLASPERIKQWAEKTLPNGKILGEVINANTLHHKTFKPQKGGLFCERIFGPLKDFECACGKPLKYKKQLTPLEESSLEKPNMGLKENSMKPVELSLNKSIGGMGREIGTKTRNFCNICEVEYTWSVMRRYQLGYIKLISPVTHVWYLKGNPSYLSILLDIKKRHLEYITYCSETLTLENALKGSIASSKSSDIVSSWNKLKEEIISAKKKKNQTEKKLVVHAHLNKVQNKIEKREKLILKRNNYWKLFYNLDINQDKNFSSVFLAKQEKQAKKDNFNDWYNLLIGPAIQLKSFKSFENLHGQTVRRKHTGLPNSILQSQVEVSNNNTANIDNTIMLGLKSYSKNPRWGLSELKFLSFIITQEKQAKLKNSGCGAPPGHAPDIGWQSGTAKQILKNISIPFYIILNLNVFSQKSIYKHVVNAAWKKLSKKAFKQALIRVNKIFNKIQTSSFHQNWLDNLKNIDTLEKQEGEAGSRKHKKSPHSVSFSGFYPLFRACGAPYGHGFSGFSGFSPKEKNQSLEKNQENQSTEKNDKNQDKTLNSDYFFLRNAKLDFYDSFSWFFSGHAAREKPSEGKKTEKMEQGDPVVNSSRDCVKSLKNYFYNLLEDQSQTKPYSEVILNSINIKRYKLAPQLKSHFYLEFYTLSNFPTSLANFMISLFYYSFYPPLGSKKNIKEGVNIFNNFEVSFFSSFFDGKKPEKTWSYGAPRAQEKTWPGGVPQARRKNDTIKTWPDGQLSAFSGFSLAAWPEKKQMEGPETTYKILFKNLSEIFFKNLIKNVVPAIKSLAYDKIKTNYVFFAKQKKYKNLNTLSYDLNFTPENIKVKDKIKKNYLKEFKSSLSIFYLVANSKKLQKIKKVKNLTPEKKHSQTENHTLASLAMLKSQKTQYHKNIQENFTDSAKIFRTILKNNLVTDSLILERNRNTSLDLAHSSLSSPIFMIRGEKELSKDKMEQRDITFSSNASSIPQGGNNSKKLYNNIYTLSHRERWEVENDWNFLYYFMTASNENIETPVIANYRDRYQNPTAEPEYNSTFTYPGSGYFNFQKSSFFSGPGIVQQLLNEFNFYEIKKMDKQNRILLYQLNKLIFKLKKYASPTPFINSATIFPRTSPEGWGSGKSRINTNSNVIRTASTSKPKNGIIESGNFRADIRNIISKHDRTSKKELKEAYKKRDLLIRRTKLVRKLFIKESSPQATILTILPVLPPDLRPIVKMGGQIAASDLNRLYQRVIYRNDRLKKFLKDPATSHSYEMKYAQRLLQEAVDNLIQNGKSGVVSEKDSRGRALKSLSDILKGKQGRFRQYLLGKRVDYSGRSVIVVGPKLKLHECGLPKEMALELYLPFLLKRILNENLARTVVGAKTLIKTNPSLIWELLREIMQTCPVLLNRAPTLHRLGIQAFQPKLIDGRAILLHPLVCSAFNADFDGDQMAVHVPITVEARAEAWKLMLSRNNILSPATGDPLAIPSQDMVLGCYYLTTNLLNSKTPNFAHKKGSGFYFSNIEDALKAYQLQELDLHANIWLKWDAFFENGSDQEEPIEIRIDSYGNWKEIYNKSQKSYYSNNNRYAQYILTTPGKVLFNQTLHTFIY